MANKKVVGELVYEIRGDDNQYNKVINNADSKAKGLGNTVSNVSSNMVRNLAGAYLGWQGLSKGIDATIGSAIRYEDAFAGVIKTVDGTEEELQALSRRFRDLSKEIPITATEFAKIGELAGQLGVPIDKIDKFAETIAKIGVTTNLTTEQASTDFARFANIMGMPLEQVDRLGSAVVELGNNLATTEQEIVDMSLGIAGAGNALGLTEPQVLGWASALSSVGIQAELGGTAVSSLLIDIKKVVSQGGKELEKFALVAGMSADDFKEAFEKDASNALRILFKGMRDIQDQGGDLTGVLDDLGITESRLTRVVLGLVGGYDKLETGLDLANKGFDENNALNIEASKRFGTTASQIQLLKNNVNDLTLSIGNALIPVLNNSLLPTLIDVFDRLSKTTSAMYKLNQEMGGLINKEQEYNKIASQMRSSGVLTKEQAEAIENAEKEINLTKELIEEKKKIQRLNEIAGRTVFTNIGVGDNSQLMKDRAWLKENYEILAEQQDDWLISVKTNRNLANKAIMEQAGHLVEMEYNANKFAGSLDKLNDEVKSQEPIAPQVDTDEVEKAIDKLNDGTKAGEEASKALEELVDRWGKLEDETINISASGQKAIRELAEENVKDLEQIDEAISKLQDKLADLKESLGEDLAREDSGIAEKIVAEERKIEELRKKIKEEQAKEKPDYSSIQALTDEIKERERILKENAELQKQLDTEIVEARRRASLSDIERSIEDYIAKKAQIQIEYEEKKLALENEIALEEENKAKTIALLQDKQEQINTIIELGNQRFQDLADNRVKITEEEVKKQISWYNKLAEAIAKSKSATRTSELPQFHKGGYVATGGEVHAGEYVVPANMVNKYGGLVKSLEGIRTGNTNTTNNNITLNNSISEQIDMDAVLKQMSFELNK